MEASALRISHSCFVSGDSLLPTRGANKLWRWRFAFSKSHVSVHPRGCFFVRNVASEKQTKRVEDLPTLGEEHRGLEFSNLDFAFWF